MTTALNFRTLDLNLLRVFDVVMAERNLTRAAERLSLTQPAVSNALKRLRESVGEDLLTRAPSGVKPTPRAEALWPEVRSALGNLHAALAPGAFDPKLDAATFRIAMADATAALYMPPLVSHIESHQARVDLRIVPLTMRDPSTLLERGDADLAIGHFPEAVAGLLGQGNESPLRHAPLHETGYVCVMRQGHPLADRPLTLDAYCAANHLLVSLSGRPHGLVDQALAPLGRQRRIVLTVNQYFTAGRVVAESDLLTVLPASLVGATGYREEVVTKPLPFRLPGMSVAMLWHLRHDRSSAHEWLRARLLEAASQASAAPPSTPAQAH
jgi:DNA-binding transcriptional LysR family regulator